MKGYILASIFIACSSLVMSAQSVDNVDQSSKTSEQFQKELKEFVYKTQEYMLEQERLRNIDSTHQLCKEQKQLEMLVNKTWCEIDSTKGAKLNSELFFDKEGLVLCFTLEDNAKQVAPEWELCKFNISDDNITITQNENKTEDYNLVKLSDDTLVLSSKGVEKSIRMFKTQSSLDNKLPSSPNNTTFDYLNAKQWQIVKQPKYLTKWHRWYFAENKWFLVDFRYNKNIDKWETLVEIREYYLAEYADHNFSRGQLSKKQKNGNFINHYIEHKHQGKHNKYNLSSMLPKIQSKSFQIIHSSDGYLLLESVPIDYQNDNIYNNGETYKYLLRSY